MFVEEALGRLDARERLRRDGDPVRNPRREAGRGGLVPHLQPQPPGQLGDRNAGVLLQFGEDRQVKRGAFALTEPLPFVGVDTGVVSGKLRIDSNEDDPNRPMVVWHVEDPDDPAVKLARVGAMSSLGAAGILTVAIGSIVVFIMKGPAYAADSLPVEHADRPGRVDREQET